MDQLVDPVLNQFNPVQSITISCFHLTLKFVNIFISQRFYHFDFFPDKYLSVQGSFNSLKTKIQIHVTNYRQTESQPVSQLVLVSRPLRPMTMFKKMQKIQLCQCGGNLAKKVWFK